MKYLRKNNLDNNKDNHGNSEKKEGSIKGTLVLLPILLLTIAIQLVQLPIPQRYLLDVE